MDGGGGAIGKLPRPPICAFQSPMKIGILECTLGRGIGMHAPVRVFLNWNARCPEDFCPRSDVQNTNRRALAKQPDATASHGPAVDIRCVDKSRLRLVSFTPNSPLENFGDLAANLHSGPEQRRGKSGHSRCVENAELGSSALYPELTPSRYANNGPGTALFSLAPPVPRLPQPLPQQPPRHSPPLPRPHTGPVVPPP